ncbi:MAG: PAS domain-containing protein [Acidobacteriota bacterium]|nr:PAS domain-containing protein [Acidobacteriota bacterium]
MSIWKAITGLPWQQLLQFAGDFLRGRIKWALITCVLLIGAAVALGYWYYERARRFEDVVQDTLTAELVPTPQYYKGLESFLVSSLHGAPDKALGTEQFNARFADALRTLATDLEPVKAAVEKAKQDAKPLAVPEVQLRVFTGNGGTVLTDNDESEADRNSFVFVPIQVLRPTLTEAEVRRLRTPAATATIQAALDDDLRRDIAFTAAFVPAMQMLAKQGVTKTGPAPEQVYVITKNGVNRIVSANAANASAYQFPETTFFPSRPYFWPVFDAKDPRRARATTDIAPSDTSTIGSHFVISRPYMDLGGSGFVITLSRGILIDGLPRAVLCIDVPVEGKEAFIDLIRRRVRELDGYTMTVACDVNSVNPQCSADRPTRSDRNEPDDPLLLHMQSMLNDRQMRERRADIFGNILKFELSSGSSGIEASVPLGNIGPNRERFLLLSFDLLKYRQKTTFIGLFACTAIGLTTLLLAYLWGTQVRQHSDYRDAFERVADVMAESPTPYLRLTSDDIIADFSGSFLDLLGYQAKDAETLKHIAFESLIDEASQEAYRRVQEARRAREYVEPYRLTLRRANGDTISVRVVSADIPSGDPRLLPETFGILVAVEEGKVVPFDLVSAARRAARARRDG